MAKTLNAVNFFPEQGIQARPVRKGDPIAEVSTVIMEFLGLLMFYIGVMVFVYVVTRWALEPKPPKGAPDFSLGNYAPLVHFLWTFVIMLGGAVMYLLARISRRLWAS